MNFADLNLAVPAANAVRFRGHGFHTHNVPHLVYLVSGIGRLTLEGGPTVVLHTSQGAWLDAGVSHALTLSDDGIALGPFLNPTAVPPGGQTRVLGPVRALSDLITVLLCAAPETDKEREPFRDALEKVLRSSTQEHFRLRLPEHPVAQAIALDAARFDGTLSDLAERHFTSVRHVQRLFLDETGLPFARWRTQARLNLAIVSLRAGEGMRAAMHVSGFATRHGLLKAVSRECGIPLDTLLRNPDAALTLLEGAA